jgi:hypothetical protein
MRYYEESQGREEAVEPIKGIGRARRLDNFGNYSLRTKRRSTSVGQTKLLVFLDCGTTVGTATENNGLAL